jgi:hypothetical protein
LDPFLIFLTANDAKHCRGLSRGRSLNPQSNGFARKRLELLPQDRLKGVVGPKRKTSQGRKMKNVNLSQLVEIHATAKPIIEKAMLEVVWDDDDDALLLQLAQKVNKLGADEDVKVALDAELGLGDTDALVRFVLSLYQMHQDDPKIEHENFERLLIQVNKDMYWEIYEEILLKNEG